MHFPIKSLAVLFVLFNAMMVSLGAEWERKSIQVVKLATHAPYTANLDDDKADQKFEIIRNSFYFFMVCGGALLGSAIALIFITLLSQQIAYHNTLDTHIKRGMYFALSTFFSIVFTPVIIRAGWVVATVNPEVCFAFAGAMAIASWWFMKVINFCLERITAAARDKGIKGVKDELTGSVSASEGQNPPPSQPTK